MSSLGNGNHLNEPDGETTPNSFLYRQERWFVDALDAFLQVIQRLQTQTTVSVGMIPSVVTPH